MTWWARGGKRAFDLLLGSVLLALCLPILMLTGVSLKLFDRGPLFFSHQRPGKNGRLFRAWKFRTMRAGRAADAVELVPLNHPEITPIGRFLRRWKLDELPQLFNVLAGHMSLVGPRPTLPEHVEGFDDFRRRRLLVRPGMTGLAQVNGNTAISWDDRILYDIAYVQRCGFALDCRILVQTVALLWRGEASRARPFLDSPYAGEVTPPAGYFKVAAEADSEP
jgi:lipopolysaccharide/colanic/teichoic acid biosynthesis glycosyltransferase